MVSDAFLNTLSLGDSWTFKPRTHKIVPHFSGSHWLVLISGSVAVQFSSILLPCRAVPDSDTISTAYQTCLAWELVTVKDNKSKKDNLPMHNYNSQLHCWASNGCTKQQVSTTSPVRSNISIALRPSTLAGHAVSRRTMHISVHLSLLKVSASQLRLHLYTCTCATTSLISDC